MIEDRTCSFILLNPLMLKCFNYSVVVPGTVALYDFNCRLAYVFSFLCLPGPVCPPAVLKYDLI